VMALAPERMARRRGGASGQSWKDLSHKKKDHRALAQVRRRAVPEVARAARDPVGHGLALPPPPPCRIPRADIPVHFIHQRGDLCRLRRVGRGNTERVGAAGEEVAVGEGGH